MKNGKKDINNFNKKIKEEREKRNMSQAKFGKLIGVSQRTISDWEKGKYVPPLRIIQMVAQRLAVNEGSFYSGEAAIAEAKASGKEVSDILNKISSHLSLHPQDAALFENFVDFLSKKNITFMLSDLWMGRVLEDLIDILVKKNIISEADISQDGWQKIMQRKMLRRKINMEDISTRS